MPDQGVYGIVPFSAHVQIRGLVIAHQQALAFEKAAHAMSHGVRHVCELRAGRRLDPSPNLMIRSGRSLFAVFANSLQPTAGRGRRLAAGVRINALLALGC